MADESAARFEILPIWSNVNEMLVELVEVVPDDRLEWSPKAGLWSFHRILLHVAEAREEWMTRAYSDGQESIGIDPNATTSKDAIKAALRVTWGRVERAFSDQTVLDATYRDRWWAKAPPRSGHWLAFHLLEHDIHHRADMLLYLALLGVETPQVWTP